MDSTEKQQLAQRPILYDQSNPLYSVHPLNDTVATSTTTTTTSSTTTSSTITTTASRCQTQQQGQQHSPSLHSSDSQESNSMSGSRRNSSDNNHVEESGLCSMFDKLKADDGIERRNSSPAVKHEEDFSKPSYRSMSVDVGAHHAHHPHSSSSHNHSKKHPNTNSRLDNHPHFQDLISKSLFFDNEKQDVHPFQTAPRNDQYLRRYAGSTEKLSSLVNKDTYNDLICVDRIFIVPFLVCTRLDIFSATQSRPTQ
ncbi:hypothetical protein BCR43DRAFT_187411 [Syncephalastrum racemosum]|uniref:Uncharacterized protein n=1 Tax=Syncephalastrum racemosum TaxID=13706 RepID=A0A1X2HQI6_SYNRA|nr:hypothetical protein BCR43DRAFT_187411 [Syncephalastrum racemosum]